MLEIIRNPFTVKKDAGFQNEALWKNKRLDFIMKFLETITLHNIFQLVMFTLNTDHEWIVKFIDTTRSATQHLNMDFLSEEMNTSEARQC